MKRIYLFLIIFPFLIFSCDEIEDATTKDFSTNLSLDIPVTVVAEAGINLKSAEAEYTFTHSGTASLKDNDQVSDYLNHLKAIDISSIKLVFSGLQGTEEVKTISISVTGVGIVATISNISSSNLTQTPDIDTAKLAQVASKLKASKELEVVVSGTTNEAPMAFNVNLQFKLTVTASLL